MNNSQHTPGPWALEQEEVWAITGPDQGRLATLNWLKGVFPRQGRRNADEVRGNAHLIAAAPELLEALEEMFDLFCGDGCMRENWDAHFVNAKSQARAAIAKAKGIQDE